MIDEIDRNRKAPFVKNFQNNYENGKLPLYALVELFSFGTLSKFYKNMKNEDKKAIVQVYGIGYTYLESWIEHIGNVNKCAVKKYRKFLIASISSTAVTYWAFSHPQNAKWYTEF